MPEDSSSSEGRKGEAQRGEGKEIDFKKDYDELAINAFRFFDIKSLDEFNQMTLKEYSLRVRALRLKEVDKDYRNHLQAFLNFAAKAEKKTGKNKSKPVYTKFKKFYDYEKAIREAKGEKKKADGRFLELSRFMKGKIDNG